MLLRLLQKRPKMQGMDLFEYAVIRIVPKVEREEFINVGVVLYCAKKGFLEAVFEINIMKFAVLDATLNLIELENYLNSFKAICNGLNMESEITRLDPASRFRWLTATRSTVIQTSKVHSGFTADPAKTLEKLFADMVR